jgi:hypothetical protein
MGRIIAGGRGGSGARGDVVASTPPLLPAGDESGQPAYSLGRQERNRRGTHLVGGLGSGIGPAQGNGGVVAVREADDEVRVDAAPDADDFQPLADEGMQRMAHHDELGRGRAEEGSVL